MSRADPRGTAQLGAITGRLEELAGLGGGKNHPGASPDDVLLWAEARAPSRGMTHLVVLDCQAIQALRDPGHPRHRRVVSHAQVVASRKRRAVIRSAPHDQVTVVTSDPGDMRLVAGDKDITVAAI